MKESIYVLITIIATTAIMLLTSMLLDWEWIQSHWTRKTVVVLLMATELFHGILVYVMISKKISKRL